MVKMFSRGDKRELALLFDIRSYGVSAVMFYRGADAMPRIIWSMEENLEVSAELDVSKFLYQTTKALKTVAAKAIDARLGAPARLFCVLSPVLYASETRVIKMSKNTPFLFTEKLADELIQKEIKLFLEEKTKQDPDFEQNIRPIELKNLKVLLNGYEVGSPVGQNARELEMCVYISMAGESVLRNIENAISSYFIGKIKFSTFAVSTFAAVRDLYAKEDSFLQVDIGGEVTDISMVKDGKLEESGTFPAGQNFILRGIAKGLNLPMDQAGSMLALQVSGHADEQTKSKIAPILQKTEKAWLAYFQQSLAGLSHDLSLPYKIYLTVDPKYAAIFTETIISDQMNQLTLTEAKFDITYLSTEILARATNLNPAGLTPALILDSVYTSRHLMNK